MVGIKPAGNFSQVDNRSTPDLLVSQTFLFHHFSNFAVFVRFNQCNNLLKFLFCLLIIDDMGLKVLPAKAGEHLFEIIMRRYETRSTIMTSNRPLEEWGKLIGDVPTATAILDRFLSRARLIQITGKSYRLKNSGQKSKKD